MARGPSNAELLVAIQGIGTRVDALGARLDTRIDGLYSRLTSVANRGDELSTRVDSLVNDLADLRVEVARQQ